MITDAYRHAAQKAEDNHYEHISLVVEPLGHIRNSIYQGKITVADVFCVLSLGLGTDGTPCYPLPAFYFTGAEIKKLMEVETSIAPKKTKVKLFEKIFH